MKRLLVPVALLPLLLAACSVSPGDKVGVTMKDYSIAVSPAEATSGRVRLAIDSVGEETHDLALMQAKSLADLARTPEGRLDLVANRPIDEIKPFEPGYYLATSPNVPAGQYLLVCTIHFDKGMVADFTVHPRKKKAGS